MSFPQFDRGALKSLARLLLAGWSLSFLRVQEEGPVREFTDDYIRDKLQTMSPDESWKAMEPLTQLGIRLVN